MVNAMKNLKLKDNASIGWTQPPRSLAYPCIEQCFFHVLARCRAQGTHRDLGLDGAGKKTLVE